MLALCAELDSWCGTTWKTTYGKLVVLSGLRSITLAVVGFIDREAALLHLRIVGVDCPECRGRSAAESEVAKLVRDAVRGLVKEELLRAHISKTDKYGRCLGDVELPEHCVPACIEQRPAFLSHLLLQLGLARSYDGSSTRKAFSNEELSATREALRIF